MALGRSVAGAELMEFDPHQSHWRENLPPMTLLEANWVMTSKRGHTLTCGIFQTVVSLEVRAGVGDDLIRVLICQGITAAREIAANWKTAADLN